jgi:hypothetical protein
VLPAAVSKKADAPIQIKPTEPANNINELKKNVNNSKIATDLIENKLSEVDTLFNLAYFNSRCHNISSYINRTVLKNKDDTTDTTTSATTSTASATDSSSNTTNRKTLIISLMGLTYMGQTNQLS